MASQAALPVPMILGGIRFAGNERNFWRALFLSACCLLVFGAGFWVRAHIVPSVDAPTAPMQILPISSELAMRYLTIPHFIIGLLFMVSSARNRGVKRRLLVAGLLLLSAGLCWVKGSLQAYVPEEVSQGDKYFVRTGESLFMLLPVILYFLVHELRDQAYFYNTLGNRPAVPDQARYERYVNRSIAWFVCLMIVGAWTVALFGKAKVFPASLSAMSLTTRLWLAGVPSAVLLATAYAIPWLYARGTSWSVGDVFSNHAPLLRVFAGVVFVLVLGLSTRTGAFLIIVLHVAGWYVFTCDMLASRPPQAAPTSWWAWMRTTLPGFRTLHIGLVVALLAVVSLWVATIGETGWLWWVVSPKTFYYWTIAHITVSFMPK